ncbi:MAG TPA: YqaA family protein [Phycisphaerae bacterium]|nr:YqaA family protein [Phycisphaerae bacterium]HOJ74785.1 YqaA family protein [Phycisphaerae bacterium]HOM51948.1 YqaA family protein [Phycisphaerae bacterium]HOQ86245.1 YqaA family protein [Phycisphaerae bacterium]HPP27428.1 YqaA family protein [Phycisphaerae bacterium]
MADGDLVEPPSAVAAVQAQKVPTWHLHRRLYDWVLSWAESRHSGWALFIMSFAESSFFPIPPDVLLMPLVLGSRRKWFRFALMCSLASVLGGIAGYIIGLTVWESIHETVYSMHIPGINAENFDKAGTWYAKYDIWLVAAAGFTPLPYKVITISAGMFKINFLTFVIASALSRAARFFLVAALMGLIGPTVKPFIDKYFNLLCILFMVLLIGGFAALKHLG